MGEVNIGIVGLGYVGTAIKSGFEKHYELETYDKYDKDKSTCDTLFDYIVRVEVLMLYSIQSFLPRPTFLRTLRIKQELY